MSKNLISGEELSTKNIIVVGEPNPEPEPEVLQPSNEVKKITYSDLVVLIAASALVANQRYQITDYRTTYNMPNVSPVELITCPVENLIVTASSANTLFAEAKSVEYPNDVILYSVENNQAKQAGCTKGYIYRRTDVVNKITAGLDWRKVKFRRWKINVTTEWDAGTTYAKWAIVNKTGTTELYCSTQATNLNHALTDTYWWVKLGVINGSVVLPWSTDWIGNWNTALVVPVDNTISTDYYIFTKRGTTNFADEGTVFDITIADNDGDIISNLNSVFMIGIYMKHSSYGSLFKDNTVSATYLAENIHAPDHRKNLFILDIFEKNRIGRTAVSNILGGEVKSNDILEEFVGNIAQSYYNNVAGVTNSDNMFTLFRNNRMVHTFQNNVFANDCNGNVWHDQCYHVIANTGFGGNVIQLIAGTSVTPCKIGTGFYLNHIKYMYRCQIGNNFRQCNVFTRVLDTDFTSSTIVSGDYTKSIIKNAAGTLKVQYTDAAGAIVTAAVTT